jgi:hypothetical protein
VYFVLVVSPLAQGASPKLRMKTPKPSTNNFPSPAPGQAACIFSISKELLFECHSHFQSTALLDILYTGRSKAPRYEVTTRTPNHQILN